MQCTKCGSDKVNVQIVSETKSKREGRGIIYWLFIGWWLEMLLWFFLTIPRVLIALFMPKRKKIVTIQHTKAVCQNCGNTWSVK